MPHRIKAVLKAKRGQTQYYFPLLLNNLLLQKSNLVRFHYKSLYTIQTVSKQLTSHAYPRAGSNITSNITKFSPVTRISVLFFQDF